MKPWIVYAALTLVVAGPLLAPGYVFALDHAMGPRSAEYYSQYFANNSDAIQNKGAYAALLAFLTIALPAWFAQKFILFAPFFVAGLGAHALASRRVGPWAAYFAGFVFALSPFAYIRGVAGQTGVLWAYALMPWFFFAYLRAADGSRRALAAAALLVGATAVFQAHGVVLLVLLVTIHALARFARVPRSWRLHARTPLLLALFVVLLNAAWIVPVMLAPETTLDRIGLADRSYFATTSSGMPSVGAAALTLQGFWRAGYEGAYDGASWLLFVPAAIFALCVHGFRTRRDEASVTLGIAGVVGFVLAVGPASPLTAPLWNAAWDHVPLVKGFRDSQKLLALLALAYADLGAAGADVLAGAHLPSRSRLVAGASLLVLPMLIATPLAWGYHGQLGVAQYPDEWAAAEAATADCSGKLLVLPWHLYMDQSWLPNRDARVTNPAKLYFSCPVISSTDVEAAGSAGRAGDATEAEAAAALAAAKSGHSLGKDLGAMGVEFVLLLKDSDWQTQKRVLEKQDDLRLVLDNARVEVYVIDAPLAHAEADKPVGKLVVGAAWTVSGGTAALLLLAAGGWRSRAKRDAELSSAR